MMPAHRVRITKPFYMGIAEVTVGQFRQFAEASGYKTEAEQGLNHGKVYKAGRAFSTWRNRWPGDVVFNNKTMSRSCISAGMTAWRFVNG